MNDKETTEKMQRINILSKKISNYFDENQNSNGVIGGLPEGKFVQWMKELDKLNKDLGITQ